jgi:hypothetical protein
MTLFRNGNGQCTGGLERAPALTGETGLQGLFLRLDVSGL